METNYYITESSDPVGMLIYYPVLKEKNAHLDNAYVIRKSVIESTHEDSYMIDAFCYTLAKIPSGLGPSKNLAKVYFDAYENNRDINSGLQIESFSEDFPVSLLQNHITAKEVRRIQREGPLEARYNLEKLMKGDTY